MRDDAGTRYGATNVSGNLRCGRADTADSAAFVALAGALDGVCALGSPCTCPHGQQNKRVHLRADSASTQGDDFKSGAFFESIFLVLVDFLIDHPKGRAVGDTLFEPGELLARLPRYSRLPDGSMVMQACIARRS